MNTATEYPIGSCHMWTVRWTDSSGKHHERYHQSTIEMNRLVRANRNIAVEVEKQGQAEIDHIMSLGYSVYQCEVCGRVGVGALISKHINFMHRIK